MILLDSDALEIGYRGRVIARIGRVALARGELACLLGRNGQGKSTLLRTLAGLQPAVAGCARLDGTAIRDLTDRERSRRIAVVLTERPDVPALRVVDLVAMGRHPYTGWRGMLSTADATVVRESLELVDGTHLADRQVDSLSDGERQRAMIARALAQQPDLLLLDEITAFLDLPSRVTVVERLRAIARTRGIAIVLSSHDLELSLQLADAVWLLPGEGRFVSGAPEDLALTGAIGRAFDQDNITFDLTTGRFESPAHGGLDVHVGVAGTAGVWCARMLRRTGYHPVATEAGGHPIIRQDADDRWLLNDAPPVDNLAAIAELLRTSHPPTGDAISTTEGKESPL